MPSGSLSLCIFVCEIKHGWIPSSILYYKGTNLKYPSPYLPSFALWVVGKQSCIVEGRDANMSKITKIGSKVPVCKGGRFPIHEINDIRSDMENSYI